MAALVAAIAVHALYLALQPGAAVEGQDVKPMPIVRLGRSTPSGSVTEGDWVSVPVMSSRKLTEYDDGDRAKCYGPYKDMPGQAEVKETPCFEGVLLVYDSWKSEFADQLIAFVFRPRDETTKRIGFRIDKAPDNCESNGEWSIKGKRIVRITINEAFSPELDGYEINNSVIRLTVNPGPDRMNNSCYDSGPIQPTATPPHGDAGTAYGSTATTTTAAASPDGYTATATHGHAAAHGDAHPYSGAYGNTYAYAHGDPYADAHADAYADTHGDAYADAHADPYTNADANGHPDASADGHAVAHGYRNADADPHSDIDANTDPAADPRSGSAAACAHIRTPQPGGAGVASNRGCPAPGARRAGHCCQRGPGPPDPGADTLSRADCVRSGVLIPDLPPALGGAPF